MERGSGLTRRRVGLGSAGLLASLVSGCLGDITGSDDHAHEHDDPPWEWGGLFELEAGTYTYAYGEGPDPDMRLAFVPADEGDEHGLYHAGETATELFEADEADAVATDGDAIQPSSETLYRVDFESSGETTLELELESDGHYSIFTEHVPAEFDAELLTDAGDEVTPDVTERHSDHEGHDHEDDGHDHGNDSHNHSTEDHDH